MHDRQRILATLSQELSWSVFIEQASEIAARRTADAEDQS
jgi:hypothetical protein